MKPRLRRHAHNVKPDKRLPPKSQRKRQQAAANQPQPNPFQLEQPPVVNPQRKKLRLPQRLVLKVSHRKERVKLTPRSSDSLTGKPSSKKGKKP